MYEVIEKLIDDLRYEPFELILNQEHPTIYDDQDGERIIFYGIKGFDDYRGFVGQCEELVYVTAQRIREIFPHAHLQIWQGVDNHHYRHNNQHIFLLMQGSMFQEDLIVDPCFKVVGSARELPYRGDRKLFDSHEDEGVEVSDILTIPFFGLTPIYYETKTSTLFEILYHPEERQFIIFGDDEPLETPEVIKEYTDNRRFLHFCSILHTYKPIPLKEPFQPLLRHISI